MTTINDVMREDDVSNKEDLVLFTSWNDFDGCNEFTLVEQL